MSRAQAFRSPAVWVHLLLLRPLLKLFFGVSVEGREHLAGFDQFILAANHNSHLDVPLLFSILPTARIRTTHPVAARGEFGHSRVVFRLVDYLFRPVWIVPGAPEEEAVDAMLETLASGHSIIIFPEGTRGIPGEIGPFKTAVGHLVGRFPEIQTIPVFLSGPEKALPRHSAVPLPIWNRVIVGPQQFFHTGCADVATALEQMMRDLARSETADRHRRTPIARACKTVAVLGIDGSGKSTLSRRLAETLSARARIARISDDVEFYENGACTTLRGLPSETLRQLLGRYAKTAKSLKHYKIPKLAELLLRDHLLGEVQRWHAPAYTLMDGSPLINLTAWARLYDESLSEARVVTQAIRILIGEDDKRTNEGDELKRPELEAMKRLGLANLAMPDVVLMLDVDPAVSMSRIHARGEQIQTHETEEKLTRLREGYLTVCGVVRSEFGVPVSVLDGSRDLDALASSAIDFVRAHSKEEQSHVERTD